MKKRNKGKAAALKTTQWQAQYHEAPRAPHIDFIDSSLEPRPIKKERAVPNQKSTMVSMFLLLTALAPVVNACETTYFSMFANDHPVRALRFSAITHWHHVDDFCIEVSGITDDFLERATSVLFKKISEGACHAMNVVEESSTCDVGLTAYQKIKSFKDSYHARVTFFGGQSIGKAGASTVGSFESCMSELIEQQEICVTDAGFLIALMSLMAIIVLTVATVALVRRRNDRTQAEATETTLLVTTQAEDDTPNNYGTLSV